MPTQMTDHWVLIAKAGAGKSTFASQMAPEYLVVDFDGRWSEQDPNLRGKAHIIQNGELIAACKEMQRLAPTLTGVRSVIWDSGTVVLDRIGATGRMQAEKAREEGKKYDLNVDHRLKADAMRLMRTYSLLFNASSLLIFHHEDSMKDGKAKVRTTLPAMELERMKQHLNAVLTIVQDPKTGMRGVRIEWCRYNVSDKNPDGVAKGQIVWDLNGLWVGVPDKISEFIREYKGAEGYNGAAYNPNWLMKYLADKGVGFLNVEEMQKKLEVSSWPRWFDRNGWGKLIEKAGAK